MAKIQITPLRGEWAHPSMFFLRENGFINVSMCSDKSVWVCDGIQIFINPEDNVLDHEKLFRLIYDSGVNYGKWTERKQLVNATTQFITNYGKENKDLYY